MSNNRSALLSDLNTELDAVMRHRWRNRRLRGALKLYRKVKAVDMQRNLDIEHGRPWSAEQDAEWGALIQRLLDEALV